MPSIHVIFDPEDRISHDAERNKQMKISVGLLRIDELPTWGPQLEELIAKVSRLTLESIPDYEK